MTCKLHDIPKALIWEAWLRVKANQGAAGIDTQTIEQFERKLGDNLYLIWNRMCSGSYFGSSLSGVGSPTRGGCVHFLDRAAD
jgi:RNA-directed DNA polymerase